MRKLMKKNIYLFKILCIVSYVPWEPTKTIVFTIHSNNAMCF